jgi:hypothetical protein
MAQESSPVRILAVKSNGHLSAEIIGTVPGFAEGMEHVRQLTELPFVPFTLANIFFVSTGTFAAFVSMAPPPHPQYLLVAGDDYANAIVAAATQHEPRDA